MPVQRTLRSLTVLLVALIFSCQAQDNQSDTANGNHAQTTPPAFTLEALDGTEITAESLQGKVLLIDFWATWCKPCISEIPEYNRLYDKFEGNDDFRFLGIVMASGEPKQIRPLISKLQIRYPVYFGNNTVSERFGGIQAFPTTFIVDREWNIRKKYVGAGAGKIEEIEEMLNELLAQD